MASQFNRIWFFRNLWWCSMKLCSFNGACTSRFEFKELKAPNPPDTVRSLCHAGEQTHWQLVSSDTDSLHLLTLTGAVWWYWQLMHFDIDSWCLWTLTCITCWHWQVVSADTDSWCPLTLTLGAFWQLMHTETNSLLLIDSCCWLTAGVWLAVSAAWKLTLADRPSW